MDLTCIFYSVIIAVIIPLSNLFSPVYGEIRNSTEIYKTVTVASSSTINSNSPPPVRNFTNTIVNTLKSRRKDKKSFINKKLKKLADTENLNNFIKQIDSTGLIRKFIKRKIHIPEHSTLELTSQVSRPNIFPNIFNQGEGFIVDAVIEWPVTLHLHEFGEAMHMEKHNVMHSKLDPKPEGKSNSTREYLAADESQGKSFPNPSEIIGLERCLIYEKLETGMSMYLDIPKNQSHDCILRAVCEAQLVADYYPDGPTSIFFEVLHLVLKPSLGPATDSCYEDYLSAEKAAYKSPDHCSSFISKCPLNMAGLFVRNFFPEIL